MKKTYKADIKFCPVCDVEHHGFLTITELTKPKIYGNTTYTGYYICPTNGDPVLVEEYKNESTQTITKKVDYDVYNRESGRIA